MKHWYSFQLVPIRVTLIVLAPEYLRLEVGESRSKHTHLYAILRANKTEHMLDNFDFGKQPVGLQRVTREQVNE